MPLTTLGVLKAAREDLNKHYIANALEKRVDGEVKGCALGWISYHLQPDHDMAHAGTWRSEPVLLLAQQIVKGGSFDDPHGAAHLVASYNNIHGRKAIVAKFDELIAKLEAEATPPEPEPDAPDKPDDDDENKVPVISQKEVMLV